MDSHVSHAPYVYLALALGGAAVLWTAALYLTRTLVRHRRGADSYLPWESILDDDRTVLTRSGDLMRVFRVDGPDLLSTSDDALETLADQVAALLVDSPDWIFQWDVVTHYHPPPVAPEVHVPHLRELIEHRFRAVASTPHLQPQVYLALTCPSTARAAFFDRTDSEIHNRLPELRLELLDGRDLRRYLAATLDGRDVAEQHVPTQPFHTRPLSWGDTSVRVLNLTELPSELFVGCLGLGDTVTSPARLSFRIEPLADPLVRRVLDERRRAWSRRRLSFKTVASRELQSTSKPLTDGAGRDLEEKRFTYDVFDAIAEADRILDRGEDRYCHLSAMLLLYGAPDELDRNLPHVRAALERRKVTVYHDEPTAPFDYLASLPGAPSSRLTARLFSATALSRALPLTQQWTGVPQVESELYPPDSPPLLWGRVSERPQLFAYTPVMGGCGHHLIFGATGTGKSTLLAAEAVCHFAQYPDARVIICDHGLSARPLAGLARGAHYDLANHTRSLNPFQSIGSAGGRHRARAWLEATLQLADPGLDLTTRHRDELTAALEALAAEPSDQWTLSTLRQLLQDHHLRRILADYGAGGPLGALLDGTSGLALDTDFIVFETEHLFQLHERLALPVLAALLDRIIELTEDRRPTLLALDETWSLLRHKVLETAVKDWLATFRKRNVAVALATQSPAQIPDPAFLAFMRAQCPGMIFAPDSSAPQASAQFAPLGLNDQQLHVIATARPRRDYLLVTRHGQALVDFHFDPQFLAALANKETPS